MIGRLNHVAIVVKNLEESAKNYQDNLGADISEVQVLPEHGVRVVFINLPNTKIELLEAYGDDSPILSFLKKNPNGGMHHVCYEVDNIEEAIKKLQDQGVTIIGDGRPKIGAHGKPVIFMHPKEFDGTLIELEQV